VLSSDDAGLMGYSGVTHDFYAALIYWNLNLKSIKKLALNSIEFSCLNSIERESLTNIWNEKYEEFIENTIKNFNL
jgi:adenosine deaminase CECR1